MTKHSNGVKAWEPYIVALDKVEPEPRRIAIISCSDEAESPHEVCRIENLADGTPENERVQLNWQGNCILPLELTVTFPEAKAIAGWLEEMVRQGEAMRPKGRH